MQLTEISDQIEAAGLNIATITYDSVETLKLVQEDQGIDFTLLHDEKVKNVDAVGIRNLDYEVGHRAYGIPYPGIFLLDTEGVIRFKFAEEDYRERPDFAGIITAAQSMKESD